MKVNADGNQKKSFYGMLNKRNSQDLSFGASGNLMFNDSSQPHQSTSGVNFFSFLFVIQRVNYAKIQTYKKHEERSDSESDEWEEIDANGTAKSTIQIELKKSHILPTEEDLKEAKNKEWEKEMRLEIARRRREMFENSHVVKFF